jgi:hypothetical protein
MAGSVTADVHATPTIAFAARMLVTSDREIAFIRPRIDAGMIPYLRETKGL